MHVPRHVPPPWEGYTVKSFYFVLAVLLYLIMFVVVTLMSATDSTTVFLATFPIILSLGLYSLAAALHPKRRLLLFATLVVPIFSSMFFVVLVMSKTSSAVNQMDAGSVIVWQLLASYFLLLLSWIFVSHSAKITNHPPRHADTTVLETNVPNTQPINANSAANYNLEKDRLSSPYYNQVVRQYAQAARAHEARASQLKSELSTTQTALAAAKLANAKEDEYRRQIAILEKQLHQEKEESSIAKIRNSDYEGHIKKLQSIVDRLKDKIEVSESNFTTRLRGIEDKCKAINFVIGRVYSDKNLGTAAIRETLNIDRSLYNAFSEMSNDANPENKKKLLNVLEAIYGKLSNLELPENKLFKISARNKLVRDESADNTILEILAKNDSDPVLDYFVEAKEICTNMINYLRK